MSITFHNRIDDTPVWTPALAVGLIFVGQIHALEHTLKTTSGIPDVVFDMVEVDPVQLSQFISEVFEDLKRTNHPLWWSMVSGSLAIATALNFRLNGRWPSGYEDHTALTSVIAQAREFLNAMPERGF